MKLRAKNKQALEEGRSYTKNLEMVVARDTENVRKNTDTINNNKTQQQYERKNLYLFSLILWWEVNIRKMFSKVINMSYWQWRTIFTDFNCNGAVGNIKTIYFP